MRTPRLGREYKGNMAWTSYSGDNHTQWTARHGIRDVLQHIFTRQQMIMSARVQSDKREVVIQ